MSEIDEFIVITATNIRCVTYFIGLAHGVLNDAIALFFEQGEISIPDNFRTDLIQKKEKPVVDTEKSNKLMDVNAVKAQQVEIPEIEKNPQLLIPVEEMVLPKEREIYHLPLPSPQMNLDDYTLENSAEEYGYKNKSGQKQVSQKKLPTCIDNTFTFYSNGYIYDGEIGSFDYMTYQQMITDSFPQRPNPNLPSNPATQYVYKLNEKLP
ncbi:hypothetical protein TVAG_451930 [Trichomonas vaginalis G3]|uniref:Uncharacterized protein n=1 Tax=Trichomonas vaginalis (strain ATCC PRA-98 / G3) TaxID=412133 RepID=A2DJR5_TRIV3|nr:hypothetical protein TVAGG3_0289930 [Trichomonas vaginalis G3]EAY19279.1 hypothetical protein TVAG_451930 [Trichomonas vaginalis G3]KAI5527181.1 hypothetical protein TVAGG3_0289930 [Trichomonas vaginalis G3]|eukprot:XP_001580265.1 hypothetical protein [Trichomonas vaginalis G3]